MYSQKSTDIENRCAKHDWPLLTTKITPPVMAHSQVKRNGVCEQVGNAPCAKLILVRAPAGFGKTTAMLQCLETMEQNGTRVAWVTLERADNDASRFLQCLAAVVANITGASPVGRIPEKSDSDLVWDGIVLAIIAQLQSHVSPFALYLDDFELIHSPIVLRLIGMIIDHLPQHGRIVIGSRGRSDLNLGRLRARGHLLEIDAEHLRFSVEETAEFFARCHQLPLSAKNLRTLHAKTEGWISAIWLASVALERCDARSAFIDQFSGSNDFLSEYFKQEVLAEQPPHIREFLLRTSILRHLNPSVCSALLHSPVAPDIFDQLDATALFLIPVDGEERTYRYHGIFASFLVAQLTQKMPDQVPQLHRAATNWYASQGRAVPAIWHALYIADSEYALRLLSQQAESLLEEGRFSLLTQWFSALPDSLISTRPLLRIVQVAALLFTAGAREAAALLERSGCARSENPEVSAHVLAIRPALLVMNDRYEEAYAVGKKVVVQLADLRPFAVGIYANVMAYIFTVMGQHDEARKILNAARLMQSKNGGVFNRMYAESIEGIIAAEKGRLRQSTAHFRVAVGAMRTASFPFGQTNGHTWASILYANILYESNQVAQADQLLKTALPLVKEAGLPDHMIIGLSVLSRIAFHQGDVDQAHQVLNELERLGHHHQLPRAAASAKLERARMLLLSGDEQASQEELQRADDNWLWQDMKELRLPANDLEYFELARLRWDIHFGDAKSALPLLEAEIAAAASAKRLRRVMKLKILHGIALEKCGDRQAALTEMGGVLKLACTEGFIRSILDEGAAATALVQLVKSNYEDDASGSRNPAFKKYLERLLQNIEVLAAVPVAIDATLGNDTLLPESLTPKEFRVLGLVSQGYSNSALAETLFVSDSTVRTHLRNINAKLGAESRTQAVAIATRRGLIC